MTASLRVGRYEALRPIASGGMATVYLGRAEGARGFERQVAIKAMHPHLAEDPEFVAMFLDEARMAANIRHPNVVPTLDVAEEGGRLFLVMEYIEGLSLQTLTRTLRKKRRSLPLPIALRISLDLLAGLHAAHELTSSDGTPMNLVHRDVSPPNVLVGVDGVSRIMDFGIAHAAVRNTSTQGVQVKGKVPYMAPEQLQSHPIDRRSDVYAAGIVTWEILTGEGLFRADNEGALVTMVLAGASRPPSSINGEIPAALDAVCMSALERSPAARYPTAAAFAEAIEGAAAAAQIAIATTRVVAAFIKELPPPPVRGAETLQTPSARTGPSTLAPASLSSQVETTSASVQGQSAIRAEPTSDPTPPARSSARPALLAAIVASLVTGVIVWSLTRDRSLSGPPATGDSLPPTATAAAGVETSAASAPAPASAAAPSSSERTAATPAPSPLKPATPKTPTEKGQRPIKPPPRSTAFRPEEP